MDLLRFDFFFQKQGNLARREGEINTGSENLILIRRLRELSWQFKVVEHETKRREQASV